MKKHIKRRWGFTLLEIVLVVTALAILAGIVLVAINPTKQLADTRNSQRKVEANTIINAVYQYVIDNGSLPTNLATTTCSNAPNEICKTGIATSTCGTLVDLSGLTTNEKYLVAIPIDPLGGVSVASGTGYNIVKTVNNRIEVCAPKAENGVTVDTKR